MTDVLVSFRHPEFEVEGPNARLHKRVQLMVDRIQRRLRGAEIGTLPDGSRRRLRGPRIHAGIGRSLKEAHAELNAAKKAGLAARKRAGRGDRPRGLEEGGLVSFLKRKEAQLRFYF